MPRRKDLKHIASALGASFISRYNDVGGYWGIGKLCLLSYQYNHSSVCIDVFHGSISPYSDKFSQLLLTTNPLSLLELPQKPYQKRGFSRL